MDYWDLKRFDNSKNIFCYCFSKPYHGEISFSCLGVTLVLMYIYSRYDWKFFSYHCNFKKQEDRSCCVNKHFDSNISYSGYDDFNHWFTYLYLANWFILSRAGPWKSCMHFCKFSSVLAPRCSDIFTNCNKSRET